MMERQHLSVSLSVDLLLMFDCAREMEATGRPVAVCSAVRVAMETLTLRHACCHSFGSV